MTNFRLHGTEVCSSELTQRSFRAAHCEFLLRVTPENKNDARVCFGDGGEYSGLHVSGIADLSFLADFPDLRYFQALNDLLARQDAIPDPSPLVPRDPPEGG